MKKAIDFEQLSLYSTPEESPGYLLWCVSMQWRRIIENVLKPLGLTHPQFVVLATVGWLTQKKEAISQAEISKSAGLDPNTISQIIRGLEIKKLIKRKRVVDERSKNPVLTDLGSSTLMKALPAVEQADKKFFEVLSSKETKQLLKFFQELFLQ